MITAQVMIRSTARTKSLHGWEQRVRLGRMQIAARRIDPQCPPVSRDFLPGGERERQLKKASQSSQAQILRGCGLAAKKFDKRQRLLLLGVRKLHALVRPGRTCLEFTERIGLIFPGEIAEAARITVQVMLRFLMIQE